MRPTLATSAAARRAVDGTGGFVPQVLERLPDDGLRYELVDGTLIVAPAPSVWHQEAAGVLYGTLRADCPPDLHVVMAPFEWQAGERSVVQPDVLVARRQDLLAGDGRRLTRPPLLAVEVHSPATRKVDVGVKAELYAECGVPSYWLVDPAPDRATITVMSLVDSRYETIAELRGDDVDVVRRPFAVRLRPADLVSSLLM